MLVAMPMPMPTPQVRYENLNDHLAPMALGLVLPSLTIETPSSVRHPPPENPSVRPKQLRRHAQYRVLVQRRSRHRLS